MKRLFIPLALLALSSNAFAQDADVPEVDFGETETLTVTGEAGSFDFNVEVADNDEQRARGLMFRKTLGPNAGMLFEYDTPRVATIWMKNTEISLDIIFVRGNGEIVKIEHSARPRTLRSASSEAVSAAVLEIPGGRAAELGITPGDVVKHSFFGTE